MDGKPVTKKIELRFIDSFRFMLSSLDKLSIKFKQRSVQEYAMVLSRSRGIQANATQGVYPYEYMDSWERFKETRLPPKEVFYSNLNMDKISPTKTMSMHSRCGISWMRRPLEITMMYTWQQILLLAESSRTSKTHV